MRLGLVGFVVTALLTGCAGLSDRGSSAASSAENGSPPDEPPVVFADRLIAAERDELRRLGERLRRSLEQAPTSRTRLRYAVWLSTPGHAGVDFSTARRVLESVLIEGEDLDRDTRAFVRLRLRHLREVLALRDNNARLTRANARLRAKIEELTELERQMGSGAP